MSDLLHASPLTIKGFSPIIDAASQVLILGTMPGVESLKQQQYYCNPRNQFWRILAEVFQAPVGEAYAEREAFLHQKHLALWDVLQHCERQGSLDEAIRNAVPNDFRELFQTQPSLRAIVFNGQKAEALYERAVLNQPGLEKIALPRLLLPSTSPAATLVLSLKVERWRQILTWLNY